ncbi:MAG: DUF362 domain-containing protein [Ruminococcus sp.]|nr:DUF362 domain-containing protein [Candidatus Apopatosoma intestinale]
MPKENAVAISHVTEYDEERIFGELARHFEVLGITKAFLSGKKVAIKPNLVMRKPPEAAATTHPTVIRALVRLLSELGVPSPVIAESPGGVYSPARMEQFYQTCGIRDAVRGTAAVLNNDTSAVWVDDPAGKAVKTFHILTPLAEADVIFDVCKLKTHSLTAMSGAVKNLFGSIPGIEKFEIHAAHPDPEDFENTVVDLCAMFCRRAEVIAVTDAIVGMEGNGPTGGNPKAVGALLTSRNPFASDLAAETVLGFAGRVGTVAVSRERGFVPQACDGLFYPLLAPTDIPAVDVLPAQSRGNASVKALRFFSGGVVGRLLSPRPQIDPKRCRGCGECVRSCPKKTIVLTQKGAKTVASIRPSSCIRCFCCQELCPFTAIDTKRNGIMKIVSLLR